MSLFKYSGRLFDGEKKTGQVTAKSEEHARKRITTEFQVTAIDSIETQADSKQRKPDLKPRSLTKLQKMLYLQHGRCFFCGEELLEKDASIEHLNPKAKGGTRTEDNEVVCHASLNHTFGSMELKRKFEFVLQQQGAFKCP